MMYGHSPTRTAPITGADWSNLESPNINAYIESKTLAEKAAWAVAEKRGRKQDLVAINPGAVFGPLLDEDPGTTAATVLRMLKGAIPAVPKIRMIVVDVRDVAALHVTAMTNPTAGGRRFLIGGGTYSFMELAAILRAGSGSCEEASQSGVARLVRPALRAVRQGAQGQLVRAWLPPNGRRQRRQGAPRPTADSRRGIHRRHGPQHDCDAARLASPHRDQLRPSSQLFRCVRSARSMSCIRPITRPRMLSKPPDGRLSKRMR